MTNRCSNPNSPLHEAVISPELIDVAALPALLLSERRKLPKCSAIYLAVQGDQILYIGKAKDLLARWGQHHRYHELRELPEVKIAWVEVEDPSLLLDIEKAFIKAFSPLLNQTRVRIRRSQLKPVGGVQKAEPKAYGEIKKCRQFMITDTASAGIDKVAEELGITRSEVIELVIRGGGLEVAKQYKISRGTKR